MSSIPCSIIGAGCMASTMAHSLSNSGHFSIKKIYDPNKEKAIFFAKEFQCEVSTSLDSAVTGTKCCYIASPPAHHKNAFIIALQKGNHVLCEKPLALTSVQADEILAASQTAASKGIVTGINFPMAFVSAITTCKNLLHQKYLAHLHKIELKLHFPVWPRPCTGASQNSWLNNRHEGGVIREIVPHFIYGLLYILDKQLTIERVNTIISYPENKPKHSEQKVHGLLELTDKTQVHLDILTNFSQDKESITLEFFGTQGYLTIENFQFLKGRKNQEPLTLLDDSGVKNPEAFMESKHIVEAFKKAIDGEPNNLPSITEGHKVQKVIDAIHLSEGKWIQLC
ncbi:Gfo/Idh/MocA family protein [Spartinivicinus ruber]|uniref:Gfo/Idh/MocA family protein n=1 Tax=Spartinivicinus ruber TaxID=2683272 RepID=UPI0013D5F039|nr:Gfo/Idh/MocA family oxidoreductase [Spartinivicinus ruber]